MQKYLLVGQVFGVISAIFPIPGQEELANGILQLFMNALKLVSLPIIFLAYYSVSSDLRKKGN